jgi:tRNA(Arg) A34 adenosine deaminase TadA
VRQAEKDDARARSCFNAGVKANPYMELALAEAELAAAAGETPVGAVVVSPGGEVAGRGHNLVIALNDPTAHAEILAIRAACLAAKSERLPGFDLYVTLEPCTMCAAAISFARIRRLYFGAADEKGGAVEHGARFFSAPTCHHAPEVYGGIGEARAAALLKEFFRKLRG